MSSSTNSAQCGSDRTKEGGFTLLEFLVAFTILTLFLTSGLMALAVAIQGDRQASFLTLASMLAKSKLAAAGIDFPLRPGSTSGRFENGYAWQATVRNYRSIALDKDRHVLGFWVEVTVYEPRSTGRSFSLGSIEIAQGSKS
jgi:general secretion pathway protein I